MCRGLTWLGITKVAGYGGQSPVVAGATKWSRIKVCMFELFLARVCYVGLQSVEFLFDSLTVFLKCTEPIFHV